MTIAIIGYGKMGKEVEVLAKQRKLTVGRVLTSENNRDGSGLTAEALRGVDVCLDFTHPTSVLPNIEALAKAGKNVVVGTTGWYDRLPEVVNLVEEGKIGLLYSANFSLGVNLFFHIVGTAAKLFDKFDSYDVGVHETHHREKADSPSGTALALGQVIIQNSRRKKEILDEAAHSGIKSEQLHVSSTRIGHVVGRHTVVFDSDADSVELTHNAKNRRGFALGAIIAAEWLTGKRGVFTMNDVLSSL